MPPCLVAVQVVYIHGLDLVRAVQLKLWTRGGANEYFTFYWNTSSVHPPHLLPTRWRGSLWTMLRSQGVPGSANFPNSNQKKTTSSSTMTGRRAFSGGCFFVCELGLLASRDRNGEAHFVVLTARARECVCVCTVSGAPIRWLRWFWSRLCWSMWQCSRKGPRTRTPTSGGVAQARHHPSLCLQDLWLVILCFGHAGGWCQ